ncbi:hypothetical protein HDU67_004392 [Dinochytrium kinnereticum]|nr:hypothetical protein HDU67_004392 [Dinochytrium kinnereticum]
MRFAVAGLLFNLLWASGVDWERLKEVERLPSTSRASMTEHLHRTSKTPSALPQVHTLTCDVKILKTWVIDGLFGVRSERKHRCGRAMMEGVARARAMLKRASRDEALTDEGLVRVGCNATTGTNGGCRQERIEWIVFSTGCTFQLNRLADQLKAAGIPLAVLGYGETWRGFGYRMRSYHDYLITLPPGTIVYATDAEDVLVNPSCSKESAVERFLHRRIPTSQIVYSAEQACFPDSYAWSQYFENPAVIKIPPGVRDPRTSMNPRIPGESETRQGSKFQYLNAGTVVGRAVDLSAMLRRIYVHDCQDDQRTYTWTYLRGDLFWIDKAEASTNESDSSAWSDPADSVAELERLMLETWNVEKTLGPSKNRTLLSQSLSKIASTVSRIENYPPHSRYQDTHPPKGPPPPSHARPLISLDFDTDIFAAIFGHTRDDFDVLPTGSVRLKSTLGEPCGIHQSGWKEANSVLEELARDLGLEYSQAAIESARRRRLGES